MHAFISSDGFGVAVRAPQQQSNARISESNATAAAAAEAGADDGIAFTFTVSAPDASGTRLVTTVQGTATQGMCTSGRGHEPIGHKCTGGDGGGGGGGGGGYHNLAPSIPTVKVLASETLDVRILVDRPIVELYINGGRAAFTVAAANFAVDSTAVRIFNKGAAAITATNVTAHGMSCAWTDVVPGSLALSA